MSHLFSSNTEVTNRVRIKVLTQAQGEQPTVSSIKELQITSFEDGSATLVITT
jgi:hypothetical protein